MSCYTRHVLAKEMFPLLGALWWVYAAVFLRMKKLDAKARCKQKQHQCQPGCLFAAGGPHRGWHNTWIEQCAACAAAQHTDMSAVITVQPGGGQPAPLGPPCQ